VIAAAILSLAPLVAFGGTIVCEMLGRRAVAYGVLPLLLLALVGGTWGFVAAIRERERLKRIGEDDRPRGLWLVTLTIPFAALATLLGSFIVFASTVAFSRGRQLRERGRPRFAMLVAGDAWLDDVRAIVAPPSVAQAWRENGKTEHASVAAFAKLSTELVALGAPAHLVEAAHRDALDEMRHTRLCFSLARAIDGQSIEPGALSTPPSLPSIPRTVRLARLAIESLVDGALHEGTSARTVARLAPRVGDDGIRAVLVAIAADEGRHARHGWDALAWCLDCGGPLVRAAVAGALHALPTHIGSSLYGNDEADRGLLEAFGIPGRALQDAVYGEVRAQVVAKASSMLSQPPPPS
jgi:hypothetical protein